MIPLSVGPSGCDLSGRIKDKCRCAESARNFSALDAAAAGATRSRAVDLGAEVEIGYESGARGVPLRSGWSVLISALESVLLSDNEPFPCGFIAVVPLTGTAGRAGTGAEGAGDRKGRLAFG